MTLQADDWTRRIERLPFRPMLALGTVLGAGLGGWLLFALPPGSSTVAAAGVCAGLGLGALVAWRLRAVALPRAEVEVQEGPKPLLDMVAIDGGEFLMGSANGDSTGDSAERPQHKVRLSPFLLGRTPVTRAQYRALMAEVPEKWPADGDGDLPANYTTWFDAIRFCNALSEREGYAAAYRLDGDTVEPLAGSDGYRLPTEAEWEYACRAGSDTPWFWGRSLNRFWGIGRYAWYSKSKVHPVAGKRPNRWGLHDMAGNVWEWCQDWYGEYPKGPQTDPVGPPSGDAQVLRGGSAWVEPEFLRSAVRLGVDPGNRVRSFGFRCARPRRQP